MKKIIFISIIFLSIFIFKKELFPNEFIHKNPYKKIETFYNKSYRTNDNFLNISVTKLTPIPIEGTQETNYIILKPEEKTSLKFIAVTSLDNLFPAKENNKIFKQENILPITLVHGNIQIEKIYSYSIGKPTPMVFNITLDKRFKNTFLNLAGKGTDSPEKLKDTTLDYNPMIVCEGPSGNNDVTSVESIKNTTELKAIDSYKFYNLENNHQIAYSTISAPEDEYIKNCIFFKADGSIENCDILLKNGRQIHLNIKYINKDTYVGSASVNLTKAPRGALFIFPESDKCFNDESFDSTPREDTGTYITLEHVKGYLPQFINLLIDHIIVNDNGITYSIQKSKYGEFGIFQLNCFNNHLRIGTGRELIELKHHIIYEYFYHDVSLGKFTIDLIQNGPTPPPSYPVGDGNIDLSLGLPSTTYIFDEPAKEILKNATIHSTGIIDISNFNGKFANVNGVVSKNIVDTMIYGLNGETTKTINKKSIYENNKISIGFNNDGLFQVHKKDSKKTYRDKLFLKFRYGNITLGELTLNLTNDLPMGFSGEGNLNLNSSTIGKIYTFSKSEKEYSDENFESNGILTLEHIKGFIPQTYGLGKTNIIDSMKVIINGAQEKIISGNHYENANYSINLNSNGEMELIKKKFGIYNDTIQLKYLYKDISIGTFTFHITNLYTGNCNLEIVPNKITDANYTFDSTGKQLTGDKNIQLINKKMPIGDYIDKFKIESDLGIKEKTIEKGKDNLLEFQKDGNTFKIGFDKNKHFNISLIKASSKNLDFNFKLIGTYENIPFESFDFTLKRNSLEHTKRELNMVLNNPSEHLLSNRNQGILLGKNLQPYNKDSQCEENTTGTGTPIDTDFSSKAYLRILKFKNREYEVKYDPQEDAYVTESIEICPNFKSSFYLNSKNGTFGFKKNLQWNGDEVKETFTYLEYNSLGEISTEYSINLNINKFIPKTSVIEVSIPSGFTLPFEVIIDSQGNPSNKRISINYQGQVPYLNPEDSKIECIKGDTKSILDIHNPLFSVNKKHKKYTVGYQNSQLYLKINSVDLKTPLDETIVLSQDINNSLNGSPIHRSDYKIILKRKPIFISIEGDTMDFGDMITKGGIYYGKSKIILTNTENKIIKTKVINPDCFLVNENNPEDKLSIKDINLTDVLNTSLNTSIFYIQGTVNVTDQGPGNYKGNIILELTLDS